MHRCGRQSDKRSHPRPCVKIVGGAQTQRKSLDKCALAKECQSEEAEGPQSYITMYKFFPYYMLNERR